MASVQEKYLLKWVWTLFSWHHWRQPPRPTSWANHPLCTSPVCLSKGHYCCSEFHRGLVKKRRSLLFKWFPTNYRGTRTPFISLSLCPLCSWCVFPPSCHSPNLSSRFFCIPSFILLNTPCNISQGYCFSCSPQSSRRQTKNHARTWLLLASLLIHQIFCNITSVIFKSPNNSN